MSSTTPRVDLAADLRRRAGVDPADGDAPEHQPAAPADVSAAERQRIIAAERSGAVEVLKACDLAGRPDLAHNLVTSGASLSNALETLAHARRTARGPGRA